MNPIANIVAATMLTIRIDLFIFLVRIPNSDDTAIVAEKTMSVRKVLVMKGWASMKRYLLR